VLPFADGAILLAGTMFFRFIAHRANDRTGHGSLHGKLYLTLTTCGKASVPPSPRRIYPLTAPVLSPFSALPVISALYAASFDACKGAC